MRLNRIGTADQATVLDAGICVAAAALTAGVTWNPSALAGPGRSGSAWFLVLLPLLVGAPLAVRRRAPLVMWTALWAVTCLQYLIAPHAPAPEAGLVLALFVGGYSVAAHSSLRRALAGLAIMAPGAAILVAGLPASGPGGSSGGLRYHWIPFAQPRSAGLIFVGEIGVCWLLGVFVRARSQAASLAARNAALERQAGQSAAQERARIARELHDIVAHHLSVVVLQAGGARASGNHHEQALEKIERSGRQALGEMRRLLGVLREPDDEPGLAPQPGLGQLNALAESVRQAGLPVCLVVDGDQEKPPAAAGVSAYRIVQEALTNVLRHAGPARARVTVGCADDEITIQVTDDGAGTPGAGARTGGHGLAGMRERVALFGGELAAGPEPGGGFAVRARLPIKDAPP
jgi:signal transduction histidine kinase